MKDFQAHLVVVNQRFCYAFATKNRCLGLTPQLIKVPDREELKNDIVRKNHGTEKKKGWSQEELAEKLDISRQSVSKWESGDSHS